jgi:hypothetical protein
VRLAIADPPYPPRVTLGGRRARASRWYGDRHPAAADYDHPGAHLALLAQLAGFDGWALACPPDALTLYGPPPGTHLAVWARPNAAPGGARILSRWEAVIVHAPASRRRAVAGSCTSDVLVCPAPRAGFPGEKPPAWTRWVLDLLGYDAAADTVTDLFPGSGAVTAEAAQEVMW